MTTDPKYLLLIIPACDDQMFEIGEVKKNVLCPLIKGRNIAENIQNRTNFIFCNTVVHGENTQIIKMNYVSNRL